MDNFDLDKGGVKFDAGKIRMDLVPQDAIMAIAAVFTYGAIKYDDWNWAKGMRDGRIDAAYERHRAAYLLGEELDDESGLPHLWHMGCCVLMRISAQLRGVLKDDRDTNVLALHDVMERFTLDMKDPRNTVKNGGDAVDPHWAADLTKSPEEQAMLDEVVNEKPYDVRVGDSVAAKVKRLAPLSGSTTFGLTDREWRVLEYLDLDPAVRLGTTIDMHVDTFMNLVQRLKALYLVGGEEEGGHFFVTDYGKNYLRVKRNFDADPYLNGGTPSQSDG